MQTGKILQMEILLSSFLLLLLFPPNFLEHKQDKINKDAFRLSFVYNSWIYFVFYRMIKCAYKLLCVCQIDNISLCFFFFLFGQRSKQMVTRQSSLEKYNSIIASSDFSGVENSLEGNGNLVSRQQFPCASGFEFSKVEKKTCKKEKVQDKFIFKETI